MLDEHQLGHLDRLAIENLHFLVYRTSTYPVLRPRPPA